MLFILNVTNVNALEGIKLEPNDLTLYDLTLSFYILLGCLMGEFFYSIVFCWEIVIDGTLNSNLY
ncbi:TPA: hypothetical protein DIC40_07905 [Patescibacteria group bacterium]|nr:hypothetical protein [Candidatus Gracilibacteria bacterium]